MAVKGTLQYELERSWLVLDIALIMNDEKEDSKIREYLKQVDRKFYYRAIENRKKEGKVFPHRGEDGKLFVNTFQYVNLFKKK